MTRLRLDTTFLPGDMGHFIKENDPNCAQCGVRYDMYRLLHDNAKFRDYRNELRSSLNAVGLRYSTENILSPSRIHSKHIYKALDLFLLNCCLTDKI
jgi:hypothetical protein